MKGKRLTYKEKLARLHASKPERVALCSRLCQHLASGFSIDSFNEITADNMRTILEAYSEDFPRDDIECAMQAGRAMWENLGYKQAAGTCLGNSRTWFYNMSNRYGWSERTESKHEHKGAVAVQVVQYSPPQTTSQ